ncbi:MAG: aminotransferase class I/II-fold pyridoxal phosphate-dependent enzyme, partial [Gammaproteobacteria bacterium]|nr:aminotransferase class I/II-fold pyridoxal phosphate-dependent enzyme [Gammaproteobacteria bacterium]
MLEHAPGWDAALAEASGRRAATQGARQRRPLSPQPGMRVTDGRRSWVNFSGNDYLGLAAEPALAEALADAAKRHGVGSGASALVTGYSPAHQRLEDGLADYLEREAVLLCSSGYLANLAVSTSLATRGDCIVQDRLCHASLIDAARLSGARLRRYPHADEAGMERQLAAAGTGRTMLVTDGVFSMDGDVAPLAPMAGLAARHGALLVVDDAHGIGVHGPGGRGSAFQAGLGQDEVPVLVGTLGKAFGSCGAFVAGSRAL